MTKKNAQRKLNVHSCFWILSPNLPRHLPIWFLLVFLILAYQYVGKCAATSIVIPDAGFKGTGVSAPLVHVDISMYWRQARHVCDQEFNGHLVRFDTTAERNRLRDFMDDFGLDHHFWIGLQWNDSGSDPSTQIFLWDDGSCSIKADVDFFDTNEDSEYDDESLCFKEHSSSTPEWENEECTKKRDFVCQQQSGGASMQRMQISMYAILLRDSTHASCGQLCVNLEDCFLTSSIGDACVVALASNTLDSVLIQVLGDRSVDSVDVDYSSIGAGPPDPCKPKDSSSDGQAQGATRTTLGEHILINGSWALASKEPCPAATTIVQQVLESTTSTTTSTTTTTSTVTETLTVTASVPGVAGPSITTSIETTTTTETYTTVVPTTNVVTVYATATMTTGSPCPSMPDVHTTSAISSTPSLPASSSLNLHPTPATSTSVTTEPTISPGISHPPPTFFGQPLELLDKAKLSKTIRAKTSAPNKTESSRLIGYTMAIPFFGCFLFLILVDIYTKIFTDLRKRMLYNVLH